MNEACVYNERQQWIDVAKGIGIICIFIGHLTYWGTPISKFVFSFHLSLFFFLSGVLFNVGKYADFRQFYFAVLRKYFVAYFFFLVLGMFALPFRVNITDLNVMKLLWSTFYLGHPMPNGPLWFLVSLCGVETIYWMWCRFSNFKSGNAVLCLIALGFTFVVTYSLSLAPQIRKFIPFKLETLPVAMIFFSCGRLFAGKLLADFAISIRVRLLRCACIFCVMCVMSRYANPSCLQGSQIRDLWFFILSFMGITAVVLFAKSFNLQLLRGGVMYIGRNSLVSFAMEFVTMPVLLWLGRLFYDHCMVFYPLNHRIPLVYSMVLLLLQVLSISIIVKPITFLLVKCQSAFGVNRCLH